MVEDVAIYRVPTADADALADWPSERVATSVTARDRFLSFFADDGRPEESANDRVFDIGLVAAQLREPAFCSRDAERYRP